VALFGVAAGLTVIFYTAMFMGSVPQGPDARRGHVCRTDRGLCLPDRHAIQRPVRPYLRPGGRKLPIVLGYLAMLLLVFPTFWMIGGAANPGLADMARRQPVAVSGPDCSYSPFAAEQATKCGKLLADLSASGVRYSLSEGGALGMTIGAAATPLETYPWAEKSAARSKVLQEMLGEAGYDFAKVTPDLDAAP